MFSTDSVYNDVLLVLFTDNNFIVLAKLYMMLGYDDSEGKINLVT